MKRVVILAGFALLLCVSYTVAAEPQKQGCVCQEAGRYCTCTKDGNCGCLTSAPNQPELEGTLSAPQPVPNRSYVIFLVRTKDSADNEIPILLDGKAKVSLDGKSAEPGQLSEGMQVKVWFRSAQITRVDHLEATSTTGKKTAVTCPEKPACCTGDGWQYDTAKGQWWRVVPTGEMPVYSQPMYVGDAGACAGGSCGGSSGGRSGRSRGRR